MINISPDVLILSTKILVIVQFLKKNLVRIPWLANLIGGQVAGWTTIALTVLVAAFAGFLQYGGDGGINLDDAGQIIMAIVGAMGAKDLGKSVFGGSSSKPETSGS